MTIDIGSNNGRGVARFLQMSIREVTVGDGPVQLSGEATPTEAVLDERGRMHAGALSTMCDAIGGFCGALAALPEAWVVTTNMMLRASDRPVGASIRLTSDVLRAGKSAIVASVLGEDDDGFVVGGVVRSAVLVPEGGAPPMSRPAVLDLQRAPEQRPFYEWLGVRPNAAGDGVVIDLDDEFRNPWGIMHGGVTGALVAAAARHVVGVAVDAGDRRGARHVNDMAIHYLSPARIGPVRAVGTVLGERPDGVVTRVEIFDDGADARTVAFAIVTVGSR